MWAPPGAAGARQRLLAQEEEMTQYSPEDLNDGWEFKIVRANTGAFGHPATLRRLSERRSDAPLARRERAA